MNNSTLFDLLPAYALGALSDEERAQVEAFLASSENARAELQTYEAMLVDMATLVPLRKAPSHLTEDFSKRLAKETASKAQVAPPPMVVKPTLRGYGQLGRARILLGLAAMLLIGLGIFLIYNFVFTDSETRAIRDITANPAAIRINLNPQAGANGGNVTFITLPDSKVGVLQAELPSLPDEKQYQLWLIKPGNPEGNIVFSMTKPVRQLLVNMPASPKEYAAAGITVEPRGGSPTPSAPPIFVGNFDQQG